MGFYFSRVKTAVSKSLECNLMTGTGGMPELSLMMRPQLASGACGELKVPSGIVSPTICLMTGQVKCSYLKKAEHALRNDHSKALTWKQFPIAQASLSFNRFGRKADLETVVLLRGILWMQMLVAQAESLIKSKRSLTWHRGNDECNNSAWGLHGRSLGSVVSINVEHCS